MHYAYRIWWGGNQSLIMCIALHHLTWFALASKVTRPDPGSGSPCCVAYLVRLIVSKSPSMSSMPLSLCDGGC